MHLPHKRKGVTKRDPLALGGKFPCVKSASEVELMLCVANPMQGRCCSGGGGDDEAARRGNSQATKVRLEKF